MRHIHPTIADILATLPPGEQDELVSLMILGPGYVHPPEPGPHRVRWELERAVGWIAVPGEAWAALKG